MTLGERIAHIIKELKMNPTSFSKKLGYTNNVQIPEYIKKGVEPGPLFFERIIQEMPSVNIEWLIAEKGKPFKENITQDYKITEIENKLSVIDGKVNALIEHKEKGEVELKKNSPPIKPQSKLKT